MMRLPIGSFLALTACLLLAGCDNKDPAGDRRLSHIDTTTVDIHSMDSAKQPVLAAIMVHGSNVGMPQGSFPVEITLVDPVSSLRITAGGCEPRGSFDDLACYIYTKHLDAYKAHLGKPYSVRITSNSIDAKGAQPPLTFYDSRSGKP